MTDIIERDGLRINLPMENLMKKILSIQPKIETNINCIDIQNRKLKNKNYFKLDKFGLIIRDKEFNKKTLSSYFKNKEGELINNQVNQIEQYITKPEKIRERIINIIKNKLSNKCILYKLYKELYPDLF